MNGIAQRTAAAPNAWSQEKKLKPGHLDKPSLEGADHFAPARGAAPAGHGKPVAASPVPRNPRRPDRGHGFMHKVAHGAGRLGLFAVDIVLLPMRLLRGAMLWLAGRETRSNALDRRHAALEQRHAALEQQHAALEQQLSTWAATHTEHNALQREVEALRSERADLSTQLEALQPAVSEARALQTNLSALKMQKQAGAARMAKLAAREQAYSGQLHGLEDAIADLTQRHAEAQRDKQPLVAETDALRADLTGLQAAQAQAQAAEKSANSGRDEAQAATNKLQRTQDALANQCDLRRGELHKLQANIVEVTASENKLQNKYQAAKGRQEPLIRAVNALGLQAKKLRGEVAVQKSALARVQAEATSAELKLTSAVRKEQTAQSSYQSLIDKRAGIEKGIAQQTTRLIEMNARSACLLATELKWLSSLMSDHTFVVRTGMWTCLTKLQLDHQANAELNNLALKTTNSLTKDLMSRPQAEELTKLEERTKHLETRRLTSINIEAIKARDQIIVAVQALRLHRRGDLSDAKLASAMQGVTSENLSCVRDAMLADGEGNDLCTGYLRKNSADMVRADHLTARLILAAFLPHSYTERKKWDLDPQGFGSQRNKAQLDLHPDKFSKVNAAYPAFAERHKELRQLFADITGEEYMTDAKLKLICEEEDSAY